MTDLSIETASADAADVLYRVGSVVIGKSEALRLVLAGILAGGHVLLQDFPGLGKTLAARSFAQALGIDFTRAQFTPDLLPADLTGSFIYNQRIGDFEFREGPLFTGLLLADEINRTPPKTQAALLEAMQERQVTVEGRTFELPPPFHVLATANPVEYEGTYPLPEAQLDRFLLTVEFGYPTAEEEYDVLHTRIARQQEQVVLDPVTDAAGLLAMQAAVERVEVDRTVGEYCVALVAASRTHRDVLIGASPRGSLALMMCARALALISGRDFVLPEDVKAVAPAALAHRITVKPELWMTDVSGASVVAGLLAAVPTPAARERSQAQAQGGAGAMDPPMTGSWQPTAALVRSVVTAGTVLLVGVALGRPELLVLAAPFGLAAALAIARAPRSRPGTRVRVGHRWLHEGQSTPLEVTLETTDDLEQVTATLSPPAYVAAQPASGACSTTVPGDRDRHRDTDHEHDQQVVLTFAVSPRRWGQRSTGSLVVAATTSWSGFRWGPVRVPEAIMVALPETRAFRSDETPHPVGLIGQNRARRGGHGSEFFAIRPFQPGDPLRRVNWRTTLRTGELHSVGTTAQEDSAVLILLDAVTDLGASGGVDGAASTLDVTVRAASSVAGHHIRVGDRVALRVLGRSGQVLGAGAGVRHQRRLQEMLAQVRPGWPEHLSAQRLRLRISARSIVVVLTPLLTPDITTAMVTLARRGLDVVCIDTLVAGTLPDTARDPRSAGALAWRLRLLEREIQMTEVARRGIPVVPWRGPGSLDEVLRRLVQRSRMPREVPR